MTIQQIAGRIMMATGVILLVGCSAWTGRQDRGDSVGSSSPDMRSKSIAGVYPDVGQNGGIKPHPESVGTGGSRHGFIILGGPAEVPDIKTGTITTKGSVGDTTPKVRMGDTTFPTESTSNSRGSSNGTSGAGGK